MRCKPTILDISVAIWLGAGRTEVRSHEAYRGHRCGSTRDWHQRRGTKQKSYFLCIWYIHVYIYIYIYTQNIYTYICMFTYMYCCFFAKNPYWCWVSREWDDYWLWIIPPLSTSKILKSYSVKVERRSMFWSTWTASTSALDPMIQHIKFARSISS